MSSGQLIAVAGGTSHLRKKKLQKNKWKKIFDLLPVGAADLVALAVQGVCVAEAVSEELKLNTDIGYLGG